MIIGIPREIKSDENRVSMIPFGVQSLTRLGATVLVEKDAGIRSGFTDKAYIDAGAEIISSPDEIYERSEIIVKVKEPQEVELKKIRLNQVVFTYFHFAADENLTTKFIDTGGIALAYETVQVQNGELPLLVPMSEVAGRMAIQNGAKALESNMGGKGLLLSGVPGVEPATITILGGGIVGMNAAKLAAGIGAKVYILDISPERLKYLDDIMPSNVFTMYSHEHNIRELLPKTDLLIGAVLIVGAKAPNLVTRSMLKLMPRGAVIVDVAVDQGGCVETSKPTTHKNPIFEIDGIMHYCVANMPGAVPYTSTIALANVTYPYVEKIAIHGFDKIIKTDIELQKGLNLYKGKVTHKGVADTFNLEYHSIEDVLPN